jgi:hypothetical protein
MFWLFMIVVVICLTVIILVAMIHPDVRQDNRETKMVIPPVGIFNGIQPRTTPKDADR